MSDPEGERQVKQAARPPRHWWHIRSRLRRWHKALAVSVSLAVLGLIFVGVIPQVASYSDAWKHTTEVAPWWWVAIAVAAALSQISGVWIYQAALVGLRFVDGFLETQTTIAISSTVPAGGAVAVGMTYEMFSSFGFSEVAITTAVLTTGVWSLGVRFGLPVVGVAMLAITAHPPGAAVGAAITGVIVILVVAVLLLLVFRSETGAYWLGGLVDRVVNWVVHFFGVPPTDRVQRSLLRFRTQTIETVHSRWRLLTWAALAGQVTALVLVFFIVRAVGVGSGQVSFAAVLTSYAVARVVGGLSITPGGLGTFDATFASLLTAFGAKSSQALAADLIWRLTTFFFPILLGIVTYIIWIRSKEHVSWFDRERAAKNAT